MANKSKWTEAEWRSIANSVTNLRSEGKSHAVIACEVGCSPQTVRNILNGIVPIYFREADGTL